MPKIIKNGVTYIGTSDSAAAVSYDNTSSGLTATNVQGAIDEIKQAIIDTIYPIGSIYMSVSSTNPGTTFGVGTWEAWGSGRVPVGVDSNDTSFDTVEETGGSKSNSYTPAGTNSGGKVNDHTYTPAGTVGNTTLTAAQSGVPKHAHNVKTLYLNTSTVGSTEYGFATGGTFKGDIVVAQNTGTRKTGALYSGGTSEPTPMDAESPHKHSWTGTKATISHTVTQPTFNGTKATLSHTVTQPTFKGTAANISTVQPYITCYMWKRTA